MKRDSVTAVSAGNEKGPEEKERETAPCVASHAEPTGQGRTFHEGDVLAGKYRVERVLREGGMGLVLVATHLHLQERVALKVLVGRAAGDASAVARFLREARAATSVKSEHVVRITDSGTLEEGEPYLVMELLHGRDLRDVLRESGRLPIDVAVDYLLQVCRGLSAVHAQRIIHRDLKPANLFVTERADAPPLVKLLDFGIAKALEPNRLTLEGSEKSHTLTHASELLGSPVYMSPEQIRSSTSVDERSDVWSLGVILHELVTGEPPFRATTVSGLLAAIAADAPCALRKVLPNAPAALEATILGCLEKDVDRRIPSVAALTARLEPIAAAFSGHAFRMRAGAPVRDLRAPRTRAALRERRRRRRGPGLRPRRTGSGRDGTEPFGPARVVFRPLRRAAARRNHGSDAHRVASRSNARLDPAPCPPSFMGRRRFSRGARRRGGPLRVPSRAVPRVSRAVARNGEPSGPRRARLLSGKRAFRAGCRRRGTAVERTASNGVGVVRSGAPRLDVGPTSAAAAARQTQAARQANARRADIARAAAARRVPCAEPSRARPLRRAMISPSRRREWDSSPSSSPKASDAARSHSLRWWQRLLLARWVGSCDQCRRRILRWSSPP